MNKIVDLTTAKYKNRLLDRARLEFILDLEELGSVETCFYLTSNDLFAVGYERVVYGDHGPYVEFTKKQIVSKLRGKYNEVDEVNLPKTPNYYYYWLTPEGFSDIKVYLQLKPVADLPNAPKRKDGRPSTFNRTEGYADYRRGFYYVDPYDFNHVGKGNC